ncbi:MAG: glycosyltransferase family 1 protein [Pseudomonadota bacterium]
MTTRHVAMGVTSLTAGHRYDGIGVYVSNLAREIEKSRRFNLKKYSFKKSCPPNTRFVGSFNLQALMAFAGMSFPLLNEMRSELILVHAPDHFVPRCDDIPTIATLMDAIPISNPEWVSYRFKRVKNKLWKESFQWADRIITPSMFSADQISNHFKIAKDTIEVIPLGVNDIWFNQPDSEEISRTVNIFNLPKTFILSVGTLQPRKNIKTLLSAHSKISKRTRAKYPLVLIGKAGWNCDEELKLIEEADPASVRWLSYVSEAHLRTITHLASLTVLPSLHEGFGLPVLESFAAGTPVIASDRTSIPEVAGDAALLFDPEDSALLADLIELTLCSAALQDQCRERGLQRAKEFTWMRTAKMTMDLYENLVH